jgi:hypothetical protein
MTFHNLAAGSMKMSVFWDIAPCNLVDMTDVSKVFTASIIRATFETE